MVTHTPWDAVPGLRHGFLDARACGTTRDWERVVGAAGIPLRVATVRQVHGTRVVAPDEAGGEADGLVGTTPGLLLGIVTADCMPVLLRSRRASAIAAVHAGWRGAAGGVLEAAVARLDALGSAPDTLEAVIGPAIGPCCYVVGDEVRDAFRARSGNVTAAAWSTRGGRLVVDLRAAATALLRAAGVTDVTTVGPCTSCDPAWCSYRRDGAGAGRQLSVIGWA